MLSVFVTYCYFLGLRNLTVIDYAEKLIRRSDPNYSPDRIQDRDPRVFALFSRGDTDGVFQFESQGMRNVLTQLKPDCIEDLIAVVSLYRPGPMKSIPTYIECRHNPDKVVYKHPLLKDILDVTYGCMVYQEQVMQVLRTLAGYSLGRADIVRRAMSKKKHDVMEKERDVFINGAVDENGMVTVEGCLRRGVDRSVAESIFNEMESFASYAFNKSHAAAYAVISYKTAWLKCYYPREYMAALLSSVLDNRNKLATYITDCRRLGIEVLPPSVNESGLDFAVSGGNIRYGLLAIKNLGKAFIQQIVTERAEKPFSSFYDFCKRMHGRNMNARAVESLIKCGAFDSMGANRRQLLSVYKTVLDGIDHDSKYNMNGQMSFFDLSEEPAAAGAFEPELPDVEEYSRDELLKMENDTAGMYFSGHPADDYSEFSRRIRADRIGAILSNEDDRYGDGKTVTVVCVADKIKTQITKTNQTMAFVTAEDRYGTIEIIVFPNSFEQFGRLLTEGSVITVRGNLNYKENEEPKIICNSIEKPRTNEECEKTDQKVLKQEVKNPVAVNKPQKLYLRIDDLNSPLYEKARRLLDIFDGSVPVVFYLRDSKKSMQAPRSLWVSLNEVLIRELKRQIGEENVVVK